MSLVFSRSSFCAFAEVVGKCVPSKTPIEIKLAVSSYEEEDFKRGRIELMDRTEATGRTAAIENVELAHSLVSFCLLAGGTQQEALARLLAPPSWISQAVGL